MSLTPTQLALVAQANQAGIIAAQIQQIQDALPLLANALTTQISVDGINVIDVFGNNVPIYGFMLSAADSTTVFNLIAVNMNAQLDSLNAQLQAIFSPDGANNAGGVGIATGGGGT